MLNNKKKSVNHEIGVNINLLEDMLCSLIIKPSISAITQTRMNVNIITNVELPNYSIFHTDSLASAGGAALYISTFLNSIAMSDIILDIPLVESFWVEISPSNNGKSILVGYIAVEVQGKVTFIQTLAV